MRISDWSSDVCSSDLCFVSCNLRRVLDGFGQHRRIAQFQNIRPALLQPVKNGSDGPLGISRDPLAGKAREIAGEIRPVMHAHSVAQMRDNIVGELLRRDIKVCRRVGMTDGRSEERRGGTACGRTWKSRWDPTP